MSAARIGPHPVDALPRGRQSRRSPAPPPMRERGQVSRCHASGKVVNDTILRRPLYRGRLPVSWNMEKACEDTRQLRNGTRRFVTVCSSHRTEPWDQPRMTALSLPTRIV